MSDLRPWARIALIVVFLGPGLARVIGTEQQVMEFAAYGIPQWLRITVGIAQCAAVFLIWYRPARIASAAVLVSVSLGTLYAYLQGFDDTLAIWLPLLWIVLISASVWPRAKAPTA